MDHLHEETMMGTQRAKRTASRCTTEAESGIHTFEVVGYSFKRGVGVGNFFRSETFTVGGHDWCIRFYPDGVSEGTRKFASIALELMTTDAEVRARYNLLLLNQETGVLESIMCLQSNATIFVPHNYFIARERKLESSRYIRDNCLTIECHLTVVKESQLCSTKGGGIDILVPASDLSEHFGRLLLEEEGADVVFSVGGETFHAHKMVLTARSPVFRAQLSYGHVQETKVHCVAVEDMLPVVFKALLNFIYTDELPDFGDDLRDEDYAEIIKHLLAAADIYAMERLKLLCGTILAQDIRVENVASIYALADQRNCEGLKEICIEFMASSENMEAVVASQGYANVKRTCPSTLIDVLEKTSKRRRA